MFSPHSSSTFSSSPLQRRAVSTSLSTIMPKPFSTTSGLPLPSSSRRRPATGWGAGLPLLGGLSPRMRKRAVMGFLCLSALFLFSVMTGNGPVFGLNDSRSWASRRSPAEKIEGVPLTPARGAMQTRYGAVGNGYEREMNHIDEDDILAESELAVDNEIEEAARSVEEQEADAARQKAKVVSQATEKKNQLRALIRWIERGGVLPRDGFHAPSADRLKKMTAKEFEAFLVGIEDAIQPVSPFAGDWETDADYQLGVTVFSKSYCPHSKNAKSIIGGYTIHPSPYIVELDEREDTSAMQDMLKALTGRRTVPNVIAHFESIGGSDEVTLFHHEGTLERKLVTTNFIA